MSLDGSFVPESALSRFLARFPNLASHRKLAALSEKGGSLTADDIVTTIADPFFHPSYTIPIIGCFRPLSRKIVDTAVSKLRKVISLELESDFDGEEIGEDDIYVIDFYVGRERHLRLHELASMAFCRALDMAPFLLSSVSCYFGFSPPPFRRICSIISTLNYTKNIFYFMPTDARDVCQLLDAVRTSYRFLLMEPKVFSELWDWSCFFDLIEQTASLDLGDAVRASNIMLDIRWCAIQILSVVLQTSDGANESFGMKVDEAFTCLLRWEEFCQDTSLEKAGCYLQANQVEYESIDEAVNFSQCVEFFKSDSSSNSHILKSHRRSNTEKHSCYLKLSQRPFILTSTVKKSFEMIFMAIDQKWSVLLHGPAGAGKTALINKLACASGKDVLFIHMDEQMDSKTLIGSYVCGESPGEFIWQPGSLTQAILRGFWVVFEDIDKAPNEVQSVLLPLLEGSSSFVTGHGEVVHVGETFRLFATITTSKLEINHGIEGKFSFSALWRKVMVWTANKEDMIAIVDACYPSLKYFSSELIDTFEKVNDLASYQLWGTQISGEASAVTFHRFSIRDLLKWCKRISDLGLSSSVTGLSASDRQIIFPEAVDIFAASIPSVAKRLLIMGEIAKWLGAMAQADNLYPPRTPTQPLDIEGGCTTFEPSQTAVVHRRPFVGIRSSLHVLERIKRSIKHDESVLLVGETGTGKTTLVQHLAALFGRPLIVMNLSQQSDAADLLGGFKPTDARSMCISLYREFEKLFCRTFSRKGNEDLLRHCDKYIAEKKWAKLLKACQKASDFVNRHLGELDNSGCGSKRKRSLSAEDHNDWVSFSSKCEIAQKRLSSSSGMLFKFVEGAFISALRNGNWILLDEVNLAPPEVLQRIIGVLDGETLCLAERGDVQYVDRHEDFRLFACMNPATDAGKRELPYSFRSRFSEYFVDDVLDDADLTLFVNKYMACIQSSGETISGIVRFYKAAKKESEERLQDGANQKPQFSLRSLARALEYTKKAQKNFGFPRAIYDGFCMFFLTLLDSPSAKIMNNMILSYLLGGIMPERDMRFSDYFIDKSKVQHVLESDNFMKNYVLTRSVEEHLKILACAIYIKRYPVLLQGPTSSGKTSLVKYLATLTGHEFVRINNHEHTDLQEYLGSYITDSEGRLQFQEGVLVKAVRKGQWIVLDELNLAPSDVLEALNRLLDDNREIFVPELQETVPAHPDFMLFATQNPPMLYGGRKVLSRAFRNRFLEIHVDEIPEHELATILEKRCSIPPSYAAKMVEVMKDLQLHRQNSKVFAGKHGFITPRDLFRWANRFRKFGKSYEDLAIDGYLLLAERLRDENEKSIVLETLRRRLRVKLIIDDLYKVESIHTDAVSEFAKHTGERANIGNITWTKSMWKLFFLVERCYKLREPVLLVGETGGGKTTVCQLLSIVLGARLHILNCHQYTETSDFIGGFCPVRDRSIIATNFRHRVELVKQSKVFRHFSVDAVLSTDITLASSTIDQLNKIARIYKQDVSAHVNVSQEEFVSFTHLVNDLLDLQQKWQSIFIWQDGPLVQAMKGGDLFLVDEISLADDSVLERLNSVLEPERKLSLPEKGGAELDEVTAHRNFFILATMNPGGDYGKKELSPALRNRFTEIWVSPVSDVNELKSIAVERFIKSELSCFADYMLKFWQWFNQLQRGRTLTVRDLLSWISFMNVTAESLGPQFAFIHGVFLVLLDGLSLGSGISKSDARKLRESSLSFLVEELKVSGSAVDPALSKMESYGWGDAVMHADDTSCSVHLEIFFGVKPSDITKGHNDCGDGRFKFLAPTTCQNAFRVLRGMQLPKPVLLEGSPGVGKTSLVLALAKYWGQSVVRINLSEQTDMMDLLGSDLPVEGEDRIEFSWSDGILLQALKNGSWVLLDELNLAPQSVLEGLNAILDHRAEVYIPELGSTFKCPPSFRVFACQNPSSQGGGRKGLPRSFLNRFTKVYVDELSADDYCFICKSLHPSISETLLWKLISFNNRLYEDTMILHKYGQEGSPWEFNLRDILRSCQIIEGTPGNGKVESFLNIVYLQRMRNVADRENVMRLYEEVFGVKPFINQSPPLSINPHCLTVGSACVARNHIQPIKCLKNQLRVLPGILHSLEAAAHCVQHQWLCILVGPYSSGKTSLVRLLSQLTGNALIELNLSSATDVSELLGCFEQYDSFRAYKSVICQVEQYVDEYFALRSELAWKDLIIERKDLYAKWFSFLKAGNSKSSMSTSVSRESLDLLVKIIEQLKHDYEKLKYDLEKFNMPVPWSYEDLNKTLKTVFRLRELQKEKEIQPSAKFEWVAGDLIKAIEYGQWVVLKNANLCTPTVLDRINSLMEPERSITVNECGLVNGKPVVLSAHSKFRMFLTVDPKYGEVSRAMRNRGLEIFMMQPNWQANGGQLCQFSEINDVERFLVLSGIPFSKLVSAMSEAHMYAKTAGLDFGVRITFLELTRWVQLFQQLLMNGNQPTWSLQISWEHTYLSSLGEVKGRDIISKAKQSYLKVTEWDRFEPTMGCSLSLPGGWPTPHILRNFLCFSREACIKQNCMYLEYLGAQCAAFGLSTNEYSTVTFDKRRNIKPPLVPVNRLRDLLSLDSPVPQNYRSSMLDEFNLHLKNQMLFIAANWTFEQATENDISLYILWFKWYNIQLQPHCRFFESFLQILEQEREHPILGSWREAACNNKMLCSIRLMELAGSDESLRESQKRLDIAVESVCILRQTYQQWNTEMDYLLSGKVFPFRMLPLLYILRSLESAVLKVIVDSRELFEIYSKLLEYHIMFWKSITSSHFEHLSVIWSCMKKEAIKLHSRFPETVGALMAESLNLKNTMAFIINTEKPALWVHGGHPLLPSSPDMYRKIQQLLSYSNSIWPRTKQEVSPDAHSLVDILSANVDLRQLVMEAVCMSSFIIAKGDQDDCEPSHQVEELHQRLCIRFEHERRNLEKVFGSSTKFNTSSLRSTCSTCCTFSPEILCRKSGFESWVVTLPLFDKKSISLDIVALQKLSKCTFVDPTEVHEKVCNSSTVLRRALNYSLNFTSRSPVDFVPHQMILWILDAWCSVDSVRENVNSMILEMWFKWHSSLWSFSSQMLENPSWGVYGKSSQLLHLTRSTTLDKIIQVAMSVKDFDIKCLMLRVASRNLWEDSLLHGDLISILWSLADFLFRQIIFVHKKCFEEKDYEKVMSILSQHKDGITLEELQDLKSCIALSSHGILTSLVDTIIEPLLEELYFKCQSCDFIYNLGCAWWHIGMLRFHLLLNSNRPELPDPAMKYAFKYSRMQEKLSSLELEIKVRRECEHLAGRSSDDEKQRRILLQELEKERKRIKAKVIFRPTPSKYKNLRAECLVFMKVVSSFMELVKNLRYSEDVPSVTKEACNWQVTSTSFINKLSEDYADYVDLCQPIQVAVYEMKLGLSIAVSDALEKEYLKKVNEKSTKRILDTLYSLMQFPRDLSAGLGSETIQPNLVCVQNATAVIQVIDDNLLNNLVAESNEINPDNVVSVIHLQAISILIHLAHCASSSLIVDKVLFMNLNKMFDRCASLWIDMKSKMKAKEDCESQYYRFRPRSIKIEDILGGDLCTLDMPELDRNMTSVHEESSSEHIFIERQPAKDDENIEEWDQVPESVFSGLVLVHNRLFGSIDLVEHPGLFQLSDDERLYFFLESYRLGARIVKDMPSLQSSVLDDSLVPEHLLHICLEYEQTTGSTSLTTKAYNVYKDSNAEVMFEMVNPLVAIQEKVQSFLVDSPGHPRLEEVLETTKTLLAMPLDTPLSKALLVLHLLVSRAHLLQENHSGFSLSDQLQPIYTLVSSWQKLELESWPALLTEVLEQYEINAGKLWFPLHALLHRKPSGDYIMITMQSVEDFILTSTAGEFKKRLHLLLAFHGQLNCGICLGAYSNCHMRESLDILYNAFGYYVQFMPLVSEYIEAGRRSIEKELKEYLKIFNWEHPNNYSSVESFRRSRQKIWKLIKKFNDILQQPLMGILNQEAILRREKDPDWLDKIISVEPNSVELQCPIDLADISTEKFLWCHNWRNKADSALQRMIHESTSGIADLIRNSLASGVICDDFMTIWEEGWTSLEMICRKIAEFAHLWKRGTKNLRKRRAFGDLLKILEGCGLSRHSSMVSEVKLKSGQSSSFFLQSSYNVLHLLPKYSLKNDNFSVRRCCQKPSDDSGTSQWDAVNRYYFSSVAVVQQLRQVCLNFQKDLSLEQVNRAASFVDHLIIIQQDQRRVAYGVSDQLQTLRHCFDLLGSIEMDDKCSLPSNQHAIRKCMWQQKNIFDKLLAMTKDMRLLLLHVKNTHLSSCDRVTREANMMFDFIDKLIPSILLSKESLGKYLIGSDGAVTTANPCVPLVVSENMEQLVVFNFNTLGILKENIEKFYMQKASTENVEGHLLNRLRILVVEGKRVEEDFNSQLKACNQSNSGDGSLSELNAVAETVVEMNKLMINVLGKLGHIHTNHFVGELSENITMWKDIFDSHIKNLHLGHICDALNKTITVLSKLANCAVTGANSEVLSQIRTNLAHSRLLLDLLLTFVEGFLFEFLDAHKKIAGMSHVLARVFILLFSKGFGHAEDLAKDMACDGLQDECGTGMGEGEGINDVSDQIEDESQLLGTSDKQDGVNSSDRVPSNKDKGIEMDEDFAADTFSVSEDSGDEDEEDGEDINLEAQMGETGDGNQVVDEKQWDKDKDDRPENSAEKYEPGPSVKEINSGDRELRAKEDGTLMVEETGELGSDMSEPLSEEDNKDNASEDDNADDMEMDKKEAFEDPTGIQFDLQEPNSEDENMVEPQASDAMEDNSAALDGEMESKGEGPNPSDHTDDESSMQIEKNIENEEDATMDLESSKENIESDKLESAHPAQGVDSDDPMRDSNKVDSGVEPEMHWSNSDDTNNGLTPSRTSVGDEIAMMELSVPLRDGSRSAADQPKPHSLLDETLFVQRTQTNPYRSIGDAMEEWKERVKVSDDPQEQQLEGSKDLDDENADEYRYVSEVEMGTSQVLGPAVSDQLNCNNESKKSEADDDHMRKKENVDRLDGVKENHETQHVTSSSASFPRQKINEELLDAVSVGTSTEKLSENDRNSLSGDIVSFKGSYMREKDMNCQKMIDVDVSKSMDVEASDDSKQNAIVEWRRYELLTTKLSQELAEQLRLIMEPTLASKLQGDYRTGKRINMKKVIPYIASHFRKDKIWLRRTKPNKRAYQVVVAIDDSRSMSESHCGNIAIEALVTVCRAMSQLEVGQFAVSSFGGEGNIKILHNFDQPFTGETGVKMISNLSFKQDNTITDEPVVDLLKFFNNMLDGAVAKARMPSGQNPLHQLVLIIADGLLHEKEKLKRCVRDFLNRKRMVALIILDNPQESIVDHLEASFEDGKPSITKYLDSFPFPYYIVVKNIETLPRTLADLLRQWFELMQRAE